MSHRKKFKSCQITPVQYKPRSGIKLIDLPGDIFVGYIYPLLDEDNIQYSVSLSVVCVWFNKLYNSEKYCYPLLPGKHLLSAQRAIIRKLKELTWNTIPSPLENIKTEMSRTPLSTILIESPTGSGKTVTMLHYIFECLDKETLSKEYDKILWVCPPSIATSTITNEISKFFGKAGLEKTALCYENKWKVYDWDKINLIIVSKNLFYDVHSSEYLPNVSESSKNPKLDLLKKFKFRFVVVDEAHLRGGYLKYFLVNKALTFVSVILMSGTIAPASEPNSKSWDALSEYFNIEKHFMMGLLDNPKFKNYIKVQNIELPKRPTLHSEVMYVESTNEQKLLSLVDFLNIKHFPHSISSQVCDFHEKFFASKNIILPRTRFCRKESNLPIGTYKLESQTGKGKTLLELVYGLKKCIIFTQYISVIEETFSFLIKHNVNVIILTAKIKPSKRSIYIDNFRSLKGIDENPVVLLSTPTISGIGLNYHEGTSSIIFMEPFIDKKEFRQCVGRIDRINQKNDMYVFQLFAPETYEGHYISKTIPESANFFDKIWAGCKNPEDKSIGEMFEICSLEHQTLFKEYVSNFLKFLHPCFYTSDGYLSVSVLLTMFLSAKYSSISFDPENIGYDDILRIIRSYDSQHNIYIGITEQWSCKFRVAQDYIDMLYSKVSDMIELKYLMKNFPNIMPDYSNCLVMDGFM